MTTVSVVGARGYSGIELCKLLLNHPFAQLETAFATGDFQLSDELLDSRAASVMCLRDTELLQNLSEVVFLATPAEVSMRLAPQILAQNKFVIDLSGAFRLRRTTTKSGTDLCIPHLIMHRVAIMDFCRFAAP